MAERNVGAGDLGGAGTITGATVAPGAVSAPNLAPGAMGAQQILGTPTTADFTGPIDVRKIQERLRQFGYDVVVDGVFGPKTKAAWEDFTAKGGSMTVDPRSDGGAGGEGGGGGGEMFPGGFGMPASPAVVPAMPVSTAPLSTDPAERFPEFAALMEVPTIRWVLTRAVLEGWSPEKLAMEVRATDWWRTTTPERRAFIALEAQDPMAAAKRIADTKEKIRQVKDAYLIDLSDDALNMYARQVASGDSDLLRFQNEMKEKAKGMFPALAAQLDQGQSVRQLFDPYAQLAAKELELSPDAIELTDPKWMRALQGFDEGGKARAMTLYEWQRTLRTEESYGWDKTSQARAQAAQIGESIARTFGRVG